MSVLVVGSVAYDSIETPRATVDRVLGGSATYFATAASYFAPVNLVAVVGDDFRHEEIQFLRQRQVDLQGLTTEKGDTFRWKGRYLANMNDRETIYTHLNVFADFKPILPHQYRNSPFVFLANISPELQYAVVQQVHNPKFVAMDTMNFWISGSLDALLQTLKVVNGLLINDSEVKQLAGEENLFIGARMIQALGPKTLIIKKGEHGALMVHHDEYFYCPAYPVSSVVDPTGAGDTFAGAFMGYLAKAGTLSSANLRRAVVFGSALASFCVEDFSIRRIKDLQKQEIQQRILTLQRMTRFTIDSHWQDDK